MKKLCYGDIMPLQIFIVTFNNIFIEKEKMRMKTRVLASTKVGYELPIEEAIKFQEKRQVFVICQIQ